MAFKSNLIKIVLLTLLFFAHGLIYSQYEEVIEEEIIEEEIEESTIKGLISLTQLSTLLNTQETEVFISDYEITSLETDNSLLIDKVFFSLYELTPKGEIPKKIYFYNCKFSLNENAPLVLKGWTLSKLNIIGCEFLSPIIFDEIKHNGQYPFIIENCKFYDNIEYSGSKLHIDNLIFKNNEFNTKLNLFVPINNLTINNCNFIANKEKFNSLDIEKSHYQLDMAENQYTNIQLLSNTFSNNQIGHVFSITFEASEVGELTMVKNKLQTINLSFAEVEKSLLIDSLYVEDYIGILNFDFPETNTNIPWYNLGGEKFAIFYNEDSDLVIPYQAKSKNDLRNNIKYNDLLSAYTKFNTLYHDRGDISSANNSYVEIKDIETRKQAFTQTINPSFNNLINYKLNVFLKFFSDYATNPGKSLIQSLWVILFFTVLYMFSFSRWDGMNYMFYLHQFNLFSRYITSNDPIDIVFVKEISLKDNDIQELRNKYQMEGKEMPRILKLFGGPLHFLGKFRYDIIPVLIKLFNFHPESWDRIKSKPKKIWSGTLIVLISMLFLFYVIVVKFINSFIMSLNSFVVIGFGSLPEEDERFAMYISIIEGIIGWFLLTIFTITLLSQVLQSA